MVRRVEEWTRMPRARQKMHMPMRDMPTTDGLTVLLPHPFSRITGTVNPATQGTWILLHTFSNGDTPLCPQMQVGRGADWRGEEVEPPLEAKVFLGTPGLLGSEPAGVHPALARTILPTEM